jgi:protein ImuA
MDGSVGLIDDLRSKIARIGHRHENARKQGVLPFGVPAIDSTLPDGGLALGAIHEVSSAGSQAEHATAAALFIAGVLARLSGQVLWVTERNDLYLPALAAVGLSPARVIFAEAAKDEILQVAEDAVRARCLAGVVAEITGALAMTATRRLQLAAEQCGVTVLLLRRSRKHDDPALVVPSAAMSRWRVVTLPSPAPLPHSPKTPGLARARWHVDLLRCRGANGASWDVAACDPAGRMAPARMPSLLTEASSVSVCVRA